MKRKIFYGLLQRQFVMPLTKEQFLYRLAALTDPPFLCEIMNIETEDIIERFSDLIEDNIEELRDIFDIDIDLEEVYNSKYTEVEDFE